MEKFAILLPNGAFLSRLMIFDFLLFFLLHFYSAEMYENFFYAKPFIENNLNFFKRDETENFAY